jgi:hypothetical protein
LEFLAGAEYFSEFLAGAGTFCGWHSQHSSQKVLTFENTKDWWHSEVEDLACRKIFALNDIIPCVDI